MGDICKSPKHTRILFITGYIVLIQHAKKCSEIKAVSPIVIQVPKILFKCHINQNNLLHAFEINTPDYLKIISANIENDFGYSTEFYGYDYIE